MNIELIARNAKNRHFTTGSDIQWVWKICICRGVLKVWAIKSIIIIDYNKKEILNDRYGREICTTNNNV